MTVRIKRAKEAVPKTGSFRVEYPGGIEFFYYDDEPSRRIRPGMMTSDEAKEAARRFAREKQRE